MQQQGAEAGLAGQQADHDQARERTGEPHQRRVPGQRHCHRGGTGQNVEPAAGQDERVYQTQDHPSDQALEDSYLRHVRKSDHRHPRIVTYPN